MPITFDNRAGRYRDEYGRFLAASAIPNLLQQEQQRLAIRLQAVTRLLTADKITLPEWQTRFAQTLKTSHLAIASLAAGGKSNLNSKIYGAVGYQLRDQAKYLNGFAKALSKGELTPNQAIARSALYASSIKVSFGKAQQMARANDGFNQAKRSLDKQSQHCSDCLSYFTRGRWVAIAEVILPGVACLCRQHCRCSIVYRLNTRLVAKSGRSPLSDSLP